ncbi:MAG: penicillin-binding transpeptidase domain-containing protein [Oscillospiraceae bacterium]|nr:penicillin-binding transpeptidase domain-containing protein [Oscillospiraceae bacterium]
MRKVKSRSFSILILVAIAILGMGFYVGRYIVFGSQWASAPFNQTVFQRGILNVGVVTDRNGVILADVTDGRRTFASNADVRRSTLHVVGDLEGNVGTGALTAFASDLAGFNLITGSYSLFGSGNKVSLTIDSEINTVAHRALNGRRGVVLVSNYKTGEILCMVSNPSFDPANPPDASTISELTDPYVNHAIQSSFAPGSTFKLVTAAAAIEQINDVYDYIFECTGSLEIGNDTLICRHGPHGTLDIERGMRVSCNIVFGELALLLGTEVMAEYTGKFDLSGSISVSGIRTASGRFDDEAADGSIFLAWSGIGQHEIEVCPVTMLQFAGAIGNEGRTARLHYLKRTGISSLFPPVSGRLISRETAVHLNGLLDIPENQTVSGFDIRAKTGTAQIDGRDPHAWYVGYIANPDYPYAFVVMVEHGGSGASVARPVATRVLQAIVNR